MALPAKKLQFLRNGVPVWCKDKRNSSQERR